MTNQPARPVPSPAFLIEPADVYHGKSRDHVTSHQLQLFRRCPLLFKQKRAGLLPQALPDYLRFGAAVHTLILEGPGAFDLQFVVGGPINPKTDKPYGAETKAYAEWAAAQTRVAISDDQYALACHMLHAVRSHHWANSLLTSGQAEGVLRGDYLGLPSQIRCDWYAHATSQLVDLKTCADLDDFERSIRDYGYIHQAAFYRRLIRQHEAGGAKHCYLIGVEKKEPYRCGVWHLGAALLDDAELDNDTAMRELALCQRDNIWPTRYEDLRHLHNGRKIPFHSLGAA